MEWGNIKSNGAEGDRVLLSMMNTEKGWAKKRELFSKFINDNGFVAWHIHDGWVTHNYHSGDILHNSNINITWIWQHHGYSHVLICPNVGEKMVVVKDSPGTEIDKIFCLYCYNVIEREDNVGLSTRIKLELIEVKEAIYNPIENTYQLYHKEAISKKIQNRWINLLHFCKRK